MQPVSFVRPFHVMTPPYFAGCFAAPLKQRKVFVLCVSPRFLFFPVGQKLRFWSLPLVRAVCGDMSEYLNRTTPRQAPAPKPAVLNIFSASSAARTSLFTPTLPGTFTCTRKSAYGPQHDDSVPNSLLPRSPFHLQTKSKPAGFLGIPWLRL